MFYDSNDMLIDQPENEVIRIDSLTEKIFIETDNILKKMIDEEHVGVSSKADGRPRLHTCFSDFAHRLFVHRPDELGCNKPNRC